MHVCTCVRVCVFQFQFSCVAVLLRFHKHISEKSGASVEELSESVQEFYTVSGCVCPFMYVS